MPSSHQYNYPTVTWKRICAAPLYIRQILSQMYGEIAWQINFLVLNCIEFFFKSCSSLVGKVSLAENLPFGENALVPLFTICPIASGFLYERARSDQIRNELLFVWYAGDRPRSLRHPGCVTCLDSTRPIFTIVQWSVYSSRQPYDFAVNYGVFTLCMIYCTCRLSVNENSINTF